MSGAESDGRVKRLDALPLKDVVAHGGEGRIGFHRVFARADFQSACDFVDYAVLPPGASIGPHRHGANEEIYFVLEGDGTMTLDGRSFRVGRGAAILNRAGGAHGLKNDGKTPLKICVVQISLGSRSAEAERGPDSVDLGGAS